MKKVFFLVSTAIVLSFNCTSQGSYIVDDKDNTFVGLSGALGLFGIANQNNYGFQEMDYKAPFGLAGGMTIGKEWSRKHRLEVVSANDSHESEILQPRRKWAVR